MHLVTMDWIYYVWKDDDMDINKQKQTTNTHQQTTQSNYHDDISEESSEKNMIPDEVPRKDGPGGE